MKQEVCFARGAAVTEFQPSCVICCRGRRVDDGNASIRAHRDAVSLLGFGCGAVGGLMVRGDPLDQERAVARAIDAGVQPFRHRGAVRQRGVTK